MFSQGYIIDSHICIIAIYMLYIGLFSGRISNRAARIYLLGAIPLSLLIPLLKLPLLSVTPVALEITQATEFAVDTNNVVFEQSDTPMINYLLVIYLSGVLLMSFWILLGAFKLTLLINRSQKERIEGLRIIFTNQKISAYSVFNYIFINSALRNEQMLYGVIAHEQCHIKLHHTLDLIFMSIAKCVLWFNPAVWHTGKMLRRVHEYQVDERVLESGIPARQYINMILMAEAGLSPDFANTFSYSLTKKRLMMIANKHKQTSGKRLLATIPLIAGLMCAFSLTTKAATELPAGNIAININKEKIDPTKLPMCSIDGVMVSYYEFVKLDVEDIESLSLLKDSSAVAVYGKKAENGIIIVTTKKTQRVDEKRVTISPDKILTDADGRFLLNEDILYMIDNEPRPDNLKYIDAKKIQSIQILKGDNVVAVFGKKAKNGVMVIMLNKENTDNNSVTIIKSIRENSPKKDTKIIDSQHVKIAPYGSTEQPVIVAEVGPLFEGKDIAHFTSTVQKSITYPQKAIDEALTGRVIAEFIIERDGSISNASIIKSLSKETDEEVLNKIKNNNYQFVPAKDKDGNAVRLKAYIPITFMLN